VIGEIPVFIGAVLNIWPHDCEHPLGFQSFGAVQQKVLQHLRARQMFQQIGNPNQIKALIKIQALEEAL